MNNKLYKKRLELLGKLGDIRVSSKGNHYVVMSSDINSSRVEYGYYNVTKNKLSNVGKSYVKNIPVSRIILLTKDNVLKFKDTGIKSRFGVLSLNDIRHTFIYNKDVCKLYFYNKRCEWIVNDVNFDVLLKCHNLVKSFKSLRELLYHLGYRSKLVDTSKLPLLILGYNFSNKSNLLLSNISELEDVIRMIIDLGREDYYTSNKSIFNIHNELVEIINMKELMSISDEVIVPSYAGNFEVKMELSGLQYTLLNNARLLALNGKKQHNCISSRSYKLSEDLFYEITYEGKLYSLQCNLEGIVEFKGAYNKQVPVELLNIVNNKLYDKNTSLNPQYIIDEVIF